MKCCVVYESMYGNTHKVAVAIAKGLDHVGEVQVVPVGDSSADVLRQVDFLVVGAPTHVHGLTRPTTRVAAIDEAKKDESLEIDPDAPGIGVREWFDKLGAGSAHAAAFDTRVDKPVLLSGSAARGIAKRLKRRGYALVAEPESFFVDDAGGPLHEGEERRAQKWGSALANELVRLRRHGGQQR